MRTSPRRGAKTREGTPIGNQNALKHGAYTQESLEFQNTFESF